MVLNYNCCATFIVHSFRSPGGRSAGEASRDVTIRSNVDCGMSFAQETDQAATNQRKATDGSCTHLNYQNQLDEHNVTISP